ncbi:MAG: hypothetical protein LIR50_01060 [Bacillota bacterium]|nr:hypothetical protein [Bacillota bacterium]
MNNPTLRVMFFTRDIDMHIIPVIVNDEIKKIYEDNSINDDLILKGWEDFNLNLPEDAAYLNILLNSDTIEVNGGLFKIVEKQVKANIPRGLWIMVEPMDT